MDETQLAQIVAKIVLESKKPDHLGDAIKIGLPLGGAIIASIIGYFSVKKAAEIGKETQISIADKNNSTHLEAIDRTSSTQIDIVNSNNNTQLLMTEKEKELESWKAYEARRSARYEQLIDQMHHFNRALFLHTTNIKNWIENRESEKEIKEGELECINRCDDELHDKFLDLLGVEAKLLVNGDLNEQALIRKYGESVQVIFRRVHINNKEITVADIDVLMEEIRELRKAILVSIGNTERTHNKA